MRLPGLIKFRKCTLADERLAEKVAIHLEQMYKNVKLPPRHIPAQPDEDFDLLLGELLHRFMEKAKAPRFTMPSATQLIELSILMNDGKVEPEKLTDIVAMCDLILNRLHENGEITIPAKKETA